MFMSILSCFNNFHVNSISSINFEFFLGIKIQTTFSRQVHCDEEKEGGGNLFNLTFQSFNQQQFHVFMSHREKRKSNKREIDKEATSAKSGSHFTTLISDAVDTTCRPLRQPLC